MKTGRPPASATVPGTKPADSPPMNITVRGRCRSAPPRWSSPVGATQEDALRLVTAKVAASLRVNGDAVGDGSPAKLDDLMSGGLVATLARLVTRETQLEAGSLQQAFAEANACCVRPTRSSAALLFKVTARRK